MDETRNLILIKGENKAWQIKHCCYDPQEQRYHVTFTNGRTYPYSYSSVQWLQDPEVLNPELYHIAKDGKTFYGVQSIYVFKDFDEWWHLVFDNGSGRTFRKGELHIERSCLDSKHALNKLSYLRDISAINELKNDDGEVLLKKQYEKLTFVGEGSALACYLHPESNPIQTFSPGSLIFPFGGNTSQFKAVTNALSSQMSVIQGPPGTGKTQTILNIIANLLVREKTIQVVSNNNPAIQNILEKLSSPKYDLGFLIATLGKQGGIHSWANRSISGYDCLAENSAGTADIERTGRKAFSGSGRLLWKTGTPGGCQARGGCSESGSAIL